MKYNLKNRPRCNLLCPYFPNKPEDATCDIECMAKRCYLKDEWFEGFERELREKLTMTIESPTTYWLREFIKEILGK